MVGRKQKKHVVVVCPGCGGTGAVGNVALHHTIELAKQFNITLLSDSFPEIRPEGVTCRVVKASDFKWLRRFSHVPREYAFAREVGRILQRIHRGQGIDVVMCHGHVAATLAANPLKNMANVPYFMVAHGDIFDRPDGTYDPRLTWFYKKVTPTAYSHADLVVALSPHMKEIAIQGGADPACVKLIPNGIDPDEIGLENNNLTPRNLDYGKRMELLYVGRLAVEKGVKDLIEACGLLKKDNIDFRLQIVGSGPEKETLENLIEVLGLKQHIQFLGAVKRSDLGELYRSSHLVCVPSRNDPLPTVVLEAMAAGVAVVGADTGGIPFMINHGVTGFVCPVANPGAFTEALKNFNRDSTFMQSMGEAGRQRVKEKFVWVKIGNLLAQAIQKL